MYLKEKKKKEIIENSSVEDSGTVEENPKSVEGTKLFDLEDVFEEEEKEYNLLRLHDESDSLITSLGYSILLFGLLVVMDRFVIPNPLFLATAVFALYFSLTSMMKPSFYKTVAMSLTFPLTAFLVMQLMDYHLDINTINNGLSLIALSISLIIIPRQKIKQRSRAKINKLKNDVIRDLTDAVERQDKIINSQQKTIDEYKNISTEVKSLKVEFENEIEKIRSIKEDAKSRKENNESS